MRFFTRYHVLWAVALWCHNTMASPYHHNPFEPQPGMLSKAVDMIQAVGTQLIYPYKSNPEIEKRRFPNLTLNQIKEHLDPDTTRETGGAIEIQFQTGLNNTTPDFYKGYLYVYYRDLNYGTYTQAPSSEQVPGEISFIQSHEPSPLLFLRQEWPEDNQGIAFTKENKLEKGKNGWFDTKTYLYYVAMLPLREEGGTKNGVWFGFWGMRNKERLQIQ